MWHGLTRPLAADPSGAGRPCRMAGWAGQVAEDRLHSPTLAVGHGPLAASQAVRGHSQPVDASRGGGRPAHQGHADRQAPHVVSPAHTHTPLRRNTPRLATSFMVRRTAQTQTAWAFYKFSVKSNSHT